MKRENTPTLETALVCKRNIIIIWYIFCNCHDFLLVLIYTYLPLFHIQNVNYRQKSFLKSRLGIVSIFHVNHKQKKCTVTFRGTLCLFYLFRGQNETFIAIFNDSSENPASKETLHCSMARL